LELLETKYTNEAYPFLSPASFPSFYDEPKSPRKALSHPIYSNTKISIGRTILVALVFASLIFSGGLVAYREFSPIDYWKMYDFEDLKFAEFVREHTPSDSIVITSDFHIQVVSSLSGRTKLMGYSAWCNSHGYPGFICIEQILFINFASGTSERSMYRMQLMGAPSDDIVVKMNELYNVTHVVFSGWARDSAGKEYWKSHSDSKIYESTKYLMFDLSKIVENFRATHP